MFQFIYIDSGKWKYSNIVHITIIAQSSLQTGLLIYFSAGGTDVLRKRKAADSHILIGPRCNKEFSEGLGKTSDTSRAFNAPTSLQTFLPKFLLVPIVLFLSGS